MREQPPPAPRWRYGLVHGPPIFCGMHLEEGEAETLEWPDDVVRFDLDNDVATPSQVRAGVVGVVWEEL